MQITNTNTFINDQGKILFFSLQDFLDKIIKADCCFICGAAPGTKEFNDEHIVPNWVLKKFNLHREFITLPNKTKFRYDQYTVPCCRDCNTDLGRTYEVPLSELLSKSYEEISAEIAKNNALVHLLFKWVSLIYLKTHLKDKNLLANRDKRQESEYISDHYYWEDFHHIHCIARSHYTKADINKNVYGTVYIVPAIITDRYGGFDYVDSQMGKTVMLKLGEFCIIANLNDACAGLSMFQKQMQKINGKLSPFQLREIVAHLNFINVNLTNRPIFRSVITPPFTYQIIAEIPKVLKLLDKADWTISVGQFLRLYVEDSFGNIENKEEVLNEIEEGKRNFLFNENGEFINHSKTNTVTNNHKY